MPGRVAVVYNEPQPSGYDARHEEKAVLGVLDAVSAVQEALRVLGYEAALLPLLPPFEEARKKLAALDVDVVFNLFEGFCGQPETEILVPETLTQLGIPFTGCRAEVLRLALDKAGVKAILRENGIPTPDFQVIGPSSLHTFRLRFPCIVKPRAEDASHGITADSLVTDFTSLVRQVKEITATFHGGSLVEEFVTGREFNATVMGNNRGTVLPVSEIVYSLAPGVPRILTFAAKWEPDSVYFQGTKVVCPAEVSESERRYIAGTALRAFKLVVGTGYARVDMRMDETGTLNIIEINPNPDISPDTGAARQSAAAGMTYAEFINKIVNMALEKGKNGCDNPPHVRRRQAGADADTEKYARI
ncbi:MAG: ATP-grasp domain-containing protein [Dehalococcoidales bacterium]|jgi:D-alanine-D-alanine ligase